MEIDTKPADVELTQIPPVLEIFIDFPQVHIDQTQARAEIGYKPIVPFEAEHAGVGQNTVLQGIQRVAQEGDSLALSAVKGREIIGKMHGTTLLIIVILMWTVFPIHLRGYGLLGGLILT